MANQSLTFDLLIGRDQASDGFVRLGKSASASSDDVLALAKRLDEISKKSVEARVGLAGNKEALAQLDQLDLKLLNTGRKVTDPKITLDGAAKASAQMSLLDVQLDKLNPKFEGMANSTEGAGLSLESLSSVAMPALIGAAAAASPIVVTLGVGLGGLGLAAEQILAPVLASKNGVTGLDQAQRGAYTSVKSLKGGVADFTHSLEPEVISAFGSAVGAAGILLHDLQPVAAATGKAVDASLSGLGGDLNTPQVQQFFQFLATTAPQDVKLVTTALGNLVIALPPILEDLQPIGVQFLAITTDAAKLAQIAGVAGGAMEATGASAQKGSGGMRFLGEASHEVLINLATMGGAGILKAADVAAGVGTKSAASARGINTMGDAADDAAAHVQSLAQQVTTLTSDEAKALTPLLNYSNSLIANKNNAVAAAKALGLSHDAVGLNTAAERNSFTTVNTYISGLEDSAEKAIKAGKGSDAQAAAIRNALPLLDSAKTKNKLYWQEVATLVGWLAKLRSEHVAISVSGEGSYRIVAGSVPGDPGGGRHLTAAGWMVTGGIPGVDSVPLLAMPGEVMVSKPMVDAGEVDHLRGRIPGFNAGGVVGSHSGGSINGLTKWLLSENSATINAIAAGVSKAFEISASAGPGAGTGVTRWAPVILQALGLLGQSPGNLGAVEHRMAQESGGNPTIVNLTDSNAAAGTPSVGLMQVIGPTFASNAGPFRSTGPFEYGTSVNPLANTYAGLHHALTAYPGRSLASVMLQAGGYDNGGYLPTGASIAINNTGRPEPVGHGLGATYNITVNVPVSANPADTGRAVVAAIREFERRSGSGWRS
jgi:hypothetical protein